MRRITDERGAVAVMVGILSVVLFSIAALAVDLGNGFARKRDVQTQADMAALAGGAQLPGSKSISDAAVKAVVKYLNDNQPQSDNGASCLSTNTCVTADQLVDNNPANGEVYFDSSARLRVLTPPARVNFGLAGVMGFTHVDEQATATVEIGSPGKPEPFLLPEQCTTGQFNLKDSSSDPTAGTFIPASYTGPNAPKVNSISPLTLPGATGSTLTIYGKNLDTGTLTVDYFQPSTGDRIPTDPTTSFPATRLADQGGNNVASTSVPAGVYNRPGTWYVRINNGLGYSQSYGSFEVGNPTPPPAGCGVTSTGDFGQVESPRKLTTQLDDATALNISKGLDHMLAPFPYPTFAYPTSTGSDTCNGNGGTPPPGAQNDKDPNQTGNNCVDVKTGMNTAADTQGFITGGTTTEGTFTGLLVKDTLSGCDRFGGSSDAVRLGFNTNDDVLSCFLKPGVSVGDVTAATLSAGAQHSISSRIFDSPRFAVVPVIKYGVNPQNGYYPIKSFQPVFITDESSASKNGESYATSQNGVVLKNTKVVGIKVVAINPDALPETADYNGTLSPWLGSGTKVVRLVD